MKKYLLLTILMLLSLMASVKAQNVPPTGLGASLCHNACSQPGWNGSYWISDANYAGGQNSWLPAAVPPPPSAQFGNLFLSNYASSSIEGSMSAQMTGLVVGKKYTLKYYLMSTKASLTNGNGDPIGFGTQATVSTIGATNTQTFTEGVNTSKWIIGFLKFTATNTSQLLVINNGTKTAAGGFINVDIAGSWLTADPCDAGTGQVQVKPTLTNVCPAGTADLNNAYIGGAKPAALLWYKDAAHSPNQIVGMPSQVGPGTYYAFFYDALNDCYNTDNSTAKVVVSINACPCNAGTSQVALDKTKFSINCGETGVNLNNALPAFSKVAVWYTDPNHANGTQVQDPTNAPAGAYYAFFYDAANQCWNTDNSTAIVTVWNVKCCNAGTSQVSLSTATLTNVCPATKAALSSTVVVADIPTGTAIYWFDNPTHTGLPINAPPLVEAGTYYAFYYDAVNDCWNTDMSTAVVTVTIVRCCNAGTKQVSLTTAAVTNICPSNKVDLGNTVVAANIPSGTTVYWFDNPNRSGQPISSPASVGQGTYYAFYYDAVNDCWNTTLSTAKVTVTIVRCCNAGIKQVSLNTATVANVCPATTANLNKIVNQVAPAGSIVVWYDNPAHSGTAVDPSKVGKGTYYAFFYDAANDCYNTTNSTAAVDVKIAACPPQCMAGTDQVNYVGGNTFYLSICKTTFDLSEANTFIQSVPVGTSIVWFEDAAHTIPVQTPTAVGKGTYYAFYFDPVANCYNTDNSTKFVTVDYVSFSLTTNKLVNTCPEETVNLNSAVYGEINVVWFTNNSHLGLPVSDPYHAGQGAYYGFVEVDADGCYDSDVSTKQVDVTITPCKSTVQLSLKIALQGSMSGTGTTMRNDLQKYKGVGVLPKTDPYGNATKYSNINNTAVGAGNVVDWVKVDIKSASAPYTVLQSKSLLLRNDGSVLDTLGLIPSFDAQAGDVYIVVRHRNHLAIMSNATPFAGGPLTYNFTDNLSKALNNGSFPDQMKLINGIWCMINGDVNQDNYIQNNDVSQTRNSYKQGGVGVYSSRDLNMNSYLENQDATTQRNRYQAGYRSILSKF